MNPQLVSESQVEPSHQLFLNDKSTKYKVSPLVVMSIINHYQRQPDPKPDPEDEYMNLEEFVTTGALFGTRLDKQTIYVSSAMGFEARKKQVIDDRGQKRMDPEASVKGLQTLLDLHFSAHPSDKLVGFYKATLPAADNFSTLLNGLLPNGKLKIAKNRRVSDDELLHLIVDTKLQENSLNVVGYNIHPRYDPLEMEKYKRAQKAKQKKSKSKRGGKKKGQSQGSSGSTSVGSTNVNSPSKESDFVVVTKEGEDEEVAEPMPWFQKFTEVCVEFECTEAEMIGIHMMITCPPDGDELDAPATLMNDVEDLEATLEDLLEKLQRVEEYVRDVQDGVIDGDESLGWMINEALTSVPTIPPAKFDEIMSTKLQDMLMLAYLGKLTRAQLNIADKINQVLHKTVPEF